MIHLPHSKEKRNPPMKGTKHFSRSKPPCRLSDPANPHKLCRRRSDPPLSVCFSFKGQHLEGSRYYYYCATCDLEFHRGCHTYPPEIRHPFHLLHPLTITFLDPNFCSSDVPLIPIYYSSSESEVYDNCTHEDEVYYGSSDENNKRCKSCRKNFKGGSKMYYHCSLCNFSLHSYCAKDSPPLTIENQKLHDHTLTLFPRRVPLPCDACGFSLSAIMDSVYSCLLCNYMVHSMCIYLPRVIKLTRHPHRLSHTSSLVPSDHEFSCGVCHKTVDINYGQYSCNKGCPYAVHPKCATKRVVWDGEDLEGVPEEEEEEVIEPFVRIDDETIQHFSHDHHYLKIHGNHANNFCQACILPLTASDRFYSCIQCEFVLHETCASLPRKNYHPLHKHPLTLLHPASPNYPSQGFFRCRACYERCCGFMFECSDTNCGFQLDVICGSVSDPSIHDCHPRDHPLFFSLDRGKCMRCSSRYCSGKYLECIKCKSFLGLSCATLPSLAHYKHDKHPLTLCYGEEDKTTDLQYWCEICEAKLDAREWFYTCNSCTVTLHIACLLGKAIYMKPNHVINLENEDVYIERNSGNSRPVCDGCRRRCAYPLLFKCLDGIFCSVFCMIKLKKAMRMIEA